MTFAHQSNCYDDYEIMSFFDGYERIQRLNGSFIDFEGNFRY
jgi:hypothetical protein